MTTRERMQSGKLYFCTDEEIAKEQLECLEILYDYNLSLIHISEPTRPY